MNTDRRSFIKILGAGALSLPALAQALAAETPAAPKTYAVQRIRFYPTQCYDENGQRLRGPLGPEQTEMYTDLRAVQGSVEGDFTFICTRADGSGVDYEMRGWKQDDSSSATAYRIDGDRIVEVGAVSISMDIPRCDIETFGTFDRCGPIILPTITVTVTWREYQTS